MADTILYIQSTESVDTADIQAVICANADIAQHHKESCFATNTAILVENDIEAYKKLGIDGVYFTDDTPIKLIKEIRRDNSDIQMGIDCGESKHTAMLAGEAGVDFVVFSGEAEEVLSAVKWWYEMMEIVVVARVDSILADRFADIAEFVLLDA